jgi:hypothetical protein
MMRQVLHAYHEAGVPRAVVFSATEGLNSFFATFVPPFCIHCPVNIATVTRVYEEQKDLKMRKQLGLEPPETDIRLVMILDDLAFDRYGDDKHLMLII